LTGAIGVPILPSAVKLRRLLRSGETDPLLEASAAVLARYRAYLKRGVDETISPADDMYDPDRRAHYFHCGRDAMRLIARGLMAAGGPSVRRILDLPSGSGRVTRHLVACFPEAQVTACDLHAHHIEFCARRFAARPVLSRDDLEAIAFAEPFDLIWCGSLLTHLPADRFAQALRLFGRSLADGGIAVVTTHGRWSVFRQQQTPHPYVSPASFTDAAATLPSGFGFAPYPGHRRYGTTWSLPSYVMGQLEPLTDLRVVSFIERGWDRHQDVLIVQKTSMHARPWIFEGST